MLDKQMRHVKERVMHPMAEWVGTNISPTEVTLVGGVVGVIAAVCAWQCWYFAGLMLWIANRILDGLDGTLARMFDKQSDFGGYLDIIVDNVMYAIIPMGLALSTGETIVYIALLFLLLTFYVNSASWMILSSILEKRNHGAIASGEMTTVTMVDGLIEGTETIAFFVLFFLLPQFLAALFIIMGILVIVTILQRLHWAYHTLN